MLHLIPFPFKPRSGLATEHSRPMTVRDLNRVSGMVDELNSQWALEREYLNAQLISLSAAVVGPSIGAMFFDWALPQLALFIYLDLLFLLLSDLVKYWLAPDEVLAQGLAMQRSNYATHVLGRIVGANHRNGVPTINTELDSEYRELRRSYLQPAAILVLFLPLVLVTIRGAEEIIQGGFVGLALVSLFLHIGQAVLTAREAKQSDSPTACAVPQAAATAYLLIATFVLFVLSAIALNELFGLRKGTLAAASYSLSVVICTIILAVSWRRLVVDRFRLLKQFQSRSRQQWVQQMGLGEPG